MRARNIVWVLLLAVLPLTANAEKAPSKALQFFYRTGLKIDKYLLTGVDTNYITLPEHSWSLALTNGEEGINAAYRTMLDPSLFSELLMRSKPSLNIGFRAGYRGFGFGYSWDVLSAYSRNWNISLGSKSVGIEFRRHVTDNLTGKFVVNGVVDPFNPTLNKGDVPIATTSLYAWYALRCRGKTGSTGFRRRDVWQLVCSTSTA